jgi:hypothetical protein
MKPIRLDPDNKTLQQTGLDLLRRGEWEGLTEFIRRQPPQSAFTTLGRMGSTAPTTADLSGLLGSEGALELTIAGALLHGRAVQFRGVDIAERVSDEQWEFYLPTLAHAQELLAEANRREPALGLAAAWRIMAFIDSSEEEKDEAEAALRRATGIPVSGLAGLVSMRSEKWGGSHAEMWRVAREYSHANPPGSLALIVKAHFEQWLWFDVFDEEEGAAERARAYFEDEDVRAELRQVSRLVLEADPCRDPRALIFVDNCLASTFWCAGWVQDAKPHLQRMGKHLDRSQWPFESPRMELNRARLSARLFPV